MAERESARIRHGRLETAACQVVVIFLFAIQLHGLQHSSAAHPVLSDVEIAAALTEFEPAPASHTSVPAIEPGWLPLTGALRTPPGSSRTPSFLTSHTDVAYTRAFAPPRERELLGIQIRLAAAKNGRHAARTTTIPPPLI